MREDILILNPAPRRKLSKIKSKNRSSKKFRKNPATFNQISSKILDINGKFIVFEKQLRNLTEIEIKEINQSLEYINDIIKKYTGIL